MLQAAFVIATADGCVVPEEDAMLVRIARNLGIPPETHRALLSHFKVARQVE
jgi:tellurite resistance protein